VAIGSQCRAIRVDEGIVDRDEDEKSMGSGVVDRY
jgi:hypothetical protein